MTTDSSTTPAKAAEAEHTETLPDYEPLLTGVVVLAALFSTCVEAFGLIHPSFKWEKNEQLLLTRLGLQQARLLIWGDVMGVSSPPASVTDRAVPKHPSAAYPDLKEPTFFNTRDDRLEEAGMRTVIEAALSAIVDRQTGTTREEMMDKYGLKPPKKFTPQFEHALDVNRLEAFREKHELLKEVAETYANISTRRASSITRSSWAIADVAKFDGFIKLIQTKIDSLISLMDVTERIDRGMRMDIKALGWHLSADRQRIASDVSKLRLITEVCKAEYPQYLDATQAALDNIDRERRENIMDYNPYANADVVPVATPHVANNQTQRRGSTGLVQVGEQSHEPRPSLATNGGPKAKSHSSGLLGGFFKFGKKSATPKPNAPSSLVPPRSQSVSAISYSGPTSPVEDLTPRAHSDAGPPSSPGISSPPTTFAAQMDSQQPLKLDKDMESPASPIRSKSVGDILDLRPETEEEKDLLIQQKLERLDTNATVEDDVREAQGDGQAQEVKANLENAPSRHDQFHGLGRQGTKVQI